MKIPYNKQLQEIAFKSKAVRELTDEEDNIAREYDEYCNEKE